MFGVPIFQKPVKAGGLCWTNVVLSFVQHHGRHLFWGSEIREIGLEYFELRYFGLRDLDLQDFDLRYYE